ncbi:transglutaminase TgpA family protein [Agromyces sp. SYSU T00194]|uniref:transglutaminase TgpA family protein n=1 Tax=Agromyces chitinivorans TaxID=3158560 RepID=UPI0033948FB8
MRPETPPLTVLQSAALVASAFGLTAVALTALGPLLAGSAWWWLCALVAASVFASGLGLRILRTPASLVPVLQIVVLVVVLTVLFGAGTAIAGIVPTGATFAHFGELASAGQASIVQQSTPAIAVPGILFVLSLATGLVAVVADIVVISLRVPAMAAIPALLPVAVPGFIVEGGTDFWTVLLTGATYLLLLRVDVAVRRRGELAVDPDDVAAPRVTAPHRTPGSSTVGATLGLAGVGLLVAAVLAQATPSITNPYLFGTGDRGPLFSRGVNPFIDLGQDLRRPEPLAALHYSTTGGERPYFTLLTLDRFEGDVWSATQAPLVEDQTVDDFPSPPGLDLGVARSLVRTTVVVDSVVTTWLPVPYPARSVQGLQGSWFWDAESLAVASADDDTAGQRYVVTHLDLDPTPEQLRTASRALPDEMERFLELPGGVPDIIGETTAEVTASAGSPYDAAVLIQRYLRSSEFSYSTESPVEEGYDGGSFDVIAEFLEVKEGYCVHFASTMAVMAREAGIPSRISLGYTGGTRGTGALAGEARYDVDTHDLHAWPELYFEGIGWMPFEPTPGRGSVPDYSRVSVLGDPGATTAPTPGASAPATEAGPAIPDDPTNGSAAGAAADRAAPLARLGLGVLIVALLLSIPAVARRAVRAWRRRRAWDGTDAAAAAWSEVEATATDLGDPPLVTESPRGFAARLAARDGLRDDAQARAALETLLGAVERHRFGRQAVRPDHPLTRDLDTVVRALEHGVQPAERFRAAAVPVSLMQRRESPMRGRERPADA